MPEREIKPENHNESIGDLNSLLATELSKYDPEFIMPLLELSLQEWQSRELQKHRPRYELVAKVNQSYDSDGLIPAILALSENLGELPISNSDNKIAKRLGREVSAVLSGSKEIVKGKTSTTFSIGGSSHQVIEEISITSDWRKIIRSTFEPIIRKDQVVGMKKRRIINDTTQPELSLNGQYLGKGEIKEEDPTSASRTVDEDNRKPRDTNVVIEFEYPLPTPKKGQNLSDWAMSLLLKNIDNLASEGPGLPQKPYDVAQIYSDKKSLGNLMRSLEIAQFIFATNEKSGLNLASWNDGIGEITAEEASEFKILNWLSLIRSFKEKVEWKIPDNENIGRFVELPIGEIRMSKGNNGNGVDSDRYTARKIDLLNIAWGYNKVDREIDGSAGFNELGKEFVYEFGLCDPNTQKFPGLNQGNYEYAHKLLERMGGLGEQKDLEWINEIHEKLEMQIIAENISLSMNDAVKIIEARFNSQEKRYRRLAKDGSGMEVSTQNMRNVRNMFRELYKIYGERIFTGLIIRIDDFKFPAGDGGWFTQFDESQLPIPDHCNQVTDYMLRVAAQLYWVKNWAGQDNDMFKYTMADKEKKPLFARKDTEDMPVALDKLYEFISDFELRDRLFAKLRYQTPSSEYYHEVNLPADEDDIKVLASKSFKTNGKDLRPLIKVRRALWQVLEPQIQSLEKVEKKKEPMPDELKDICLETEEGIFLSIENLSVLIRERLLGTNEAKLKNGVLFGSHDNNSLPPIPVFWTDNLIEGVNLRFAVDSRGRYSIGSVGNPDNKFFIKGKLLSTPTQRGVKELGTDLEDQFNQKVWNVLPFGPDTVLIRPSSGVLLANIGEKTEIICPDGEICKKVPGKPIVCYWDPMGSNDGWQLDTKVLKEYVESDASKNDLWGMHQIADLVNQKALKTVSVKCPMPFHDNRDTDAASWYGLDDSPGIKCFADCETKISLSSVFEGRIAINAIKTASGFEMRDYKTVSPERHKTFENFFKLVEVISSRFPEDRDYLIEERGLDPDNDVGRFGYLPLTLTDALQKIAFSDAYKRAKKDKREFRLDRMGGYYSHFGFDNDPDFQEGYALLNQVLSNFSDEEKNVLLDSLHYKNINLMNRRGLIKRQDQIGGRLLMPAFFKAEKPVGSEIMAISNIYARGMWLRGKKRYEGEPHIKARLAKVSLTETRDINGEEVEVRLNATPAGFWHHNREKFFLSLATNKSIIITEGPLSAAALSRELRIAKIGLEDSYLCALGTGYKQYYAMLKYLGVKGFESDESLGYAIEYIYLAYDGDITGAKKWKVRSEELKRMFPEASILPVHEILPSDIREVTPPFEPNEFEEGGDWYGVKADFDDYINRSGPEMKFDVPGARKIAEALPHLHQKYTFKATNS